MTDDGPKTPRSTRLVTLDDERTLYLLRIIRADESMILQLCRSGDTAAIGDGPFQTSFDVVASDGASVHVAVWGDEQPSVSLLTIEQAQRDCEGFLPDELDKLYREQS